MPDGGNLCVSGGRQTEVLGLRGGMQSPDSAAHILEAQSSGFLGSGNSDLGDVTPEESGVDNMQLVCDTFAEMSVDSDEEAYR